MSDFAPFAAAARNHQSHALYLGHAKLLDIPSAVTITVTGTRFAGRCGMELVGQARRRRSAGLAGADAEGRRHAQLHQAAGKPAKKKIGDHEIAVAAGEAAGPVGARSARAQDVRIADRRQDLRAADKRDICSRRLDELSVGFEAIANTTPVVTNSPFHPFGREPRLFDSFYIGSDEAFSKAGADVSLCFAFGGPDFVRALCGRDNEGDCAGPGLRAGRRQHAVSCRLPGGPAGAAAGTASAGVGRRGARAKPRWPPGI